MKEQLIILLQRIGFEDKLIEELKTVGRSKRIKATETLMSPADKNEEIPFVLSGLLKVLRQDTDGHEVFLYYLDGGETCAMSLSCCLGGKSASIKVVAEEDTTLWMIPMNMMDSWVVKYPNFRRFVFNAYQNRFDELLHTIDSVVFHKMNERLYNYLLDTKQATGSFEIHKTHEQIANELSTSRVVISRLLKQLEKEEKISQHRNKIEIL